MEFVEDLKEMIEVVPASTVSKTVLTNEGVRIVLFAFDEGEELSEHTAAMPVMISLLDGELEIEADGQVISLHTGGVVTLAARVPHRVLAKRPSRMVLAMLDSRAKAPN